MEQPEAEIPTSEKSGVGVVWELENDNLVGCLKHHPLYFLECHFVAYKLDKFKIAEEYVLRNQIS